MAIKIMAATRLQAQRKDSAYGYGLNAGPDATNPYEPNTTDYDRWQQGFDEAMEELHAAMKAHTVRNIAMDDIRADIADTEKLLKDCEKDRKAILETRLKLLNTRLADW
jgi:hypothetical protein